MRFVGDHRRSCLAIAVRGYAGHRAHRAIVSYPASRDSNAIVVTHAPLHVVRTTRRRPAGRGCQSFTEPSRFLSHGAGKGRLCDDDPKENIDGIAAPTSRSTARTASKTGESQPRRHALGHEVQTFGQVRDLPLGLPRADRERIAEQLNVILADIRVLYDLYKKSHWLMRGRRSPSCTC